MIRILFILLFLFSCTDESNPLETQENNLTTMSTQGQVTPVDPPFPMIVGGEEVETCLQQNGHWQGAIG